MSTASSPHIVRLSDEEARALLTAIKNMEGDDNEALVKTLDKVEQKIRKAREKRA